MPTPVNLAELDLNLVVMLDVLLQERSLSRTATRLGQTPAAMNAGLAKLRKVVGDPLLVRSNNKLVPTARAEELHAQLKPLLGQLGLVLAPSAHAWVQYTTLPDGAGCGVRWLTDTVELALDATNPTGLTDADLDVVMPAAPDVT